MAKTLPISVVSGAAGFLGSHLVDNLLAKGHYVIGLDNLSTGSMENLTTAFLNEDRFLFYETDVVTNVKIESDLRVNFVWHLASPASPVDYRRLSIETMLVNSIGTKNMLDLAARHQARFLLASTSETYGEPSIHPQPETYWGNVNPVGERSCYDEGKRFAEAVTMEYFRTIGLNARIARIFNTFGPRMQINDGRVVPTFISQAIRGRPLTVFGRGEQTRSFIFVDDEIDGLVRAMFCDELDGEVVNLGNPRETKVIELAEIVSRLCNVELKVAYEPLPCDDPTRRCPDICYAKTVLGWEPRVSLEQGLILTIDYFTKRLNGR